MDKCRLVISALLMFLLFSGNAQDPVGPSQRKPAFAGTFYPAGQAALTAQLNSLFKNARNSNKAGESTIPDAVVQSIIVPHAGMDYSGTVAAAGYLEIPASATYKNIFIITSTHRRPFEGISTDLSSSYLTPLGEVKLNQQICRELIDQHPQINYHEAAHEREQGIEVQLPFIQYHIKNTPSIIPIVMGASSLSAARDLATALLPWFSPENLFVISADFSRYPSYADAVRVDQITANALMTGSPERFYKGLRTVSNKELQNLSTPSGDWSSIMSLLYMASQGKNLVFNPVLYRNSGDSPLGDRTRVVGYWALSGRLAPPEESTLTLSEAEKSRLLEISRSTLESFIREEAVLEVAAEKLSSTLKKPASVLVSLYMGNRLRGRLEYISVPIPLYSAVQEMTIAAASLDKRFAPVEHSELEYISIEVSILTPLRKISSIDEIDPDIHGIYLMKGDRYGLCLPGEYKGANPDMEEVLGYCAREKAGLGWDDWKDADLFTFELISFSESELNPSPSPAL